MAFTIIRCYSCFERFHVLMTQQIDLVHASEHKESAFDRVRDDSLVKINQIRVN